MIQKTYYKTKDYCKVKFAIQPETAESVEILGLNNNWEEPVAMTRKKDGTFTAEINLPKNSEHEFKYRINGTDWATEAEADRESINSFGSTNSVVVVEG